MSHKKAGGSSKNGRDSQAQRLGIKVYGEQAVLAGGIIVRQKGSKFIPGQNAGMGKDYTIFSKVTGTVRFTEKKVKKYDGRVFKNKLVNIIPLQVTAK
jgi:large subunit ribosomal protein L27